MSLDVYLVAVVPPCEDGDSEVEVLLTSGLNITHNLGRMAAAAGVYRVMWRPDELRMTHAYQIIPTLERGHELLRRNGAYFRQFDAPNGWGRYQSLLDFTREYLRQCVEYPDAQIRVSR